MTAYRLLVTKGGIRTGETVLVRAVGSGVGVMASQIAKAAGAQVIGTAGSQEKLERATELGVDHTINHTTDDVSRRIKELTSGMGVDLVVDYVGAATWTDNLRCMGRSGRLVLCGAHTGTKVELDLWHLFAKEHAITGSYGGTRQELEHALNLIEDGEITPVIGTTTDLASATQAIDDLETRNVFGKVLIKPE
jgi:NADPH2:quinone reductase